MFADDVIIYAENPQKKLEPVNKFNKVVGYRVNIQELIAFLYTNDNLKRKLRKEFHL